MQESRPRRTETQLGEQLVTKNYQTQAEKELIESTLAGENQDLKPIVKDEDLRRIWLSCFNPKALRKKEINATDVQVLAGKRLPNTL
jgi:hypothetical protein